MPKLLGLRLLLRLPLERLKELGEAEACEVEEGEDAQRLQRLRLLLSREDAGLEEAPVADEHEHDFRQAHAQELMVRNPILSGIRVQILAASCHCGKLLRVVSFLVYEVTSFL